jgi:hypothetical protein
MIVPPVHGIPPSIPVGASLLNRTLDLLDRVETLPQDAAGALRFGAQGMLLVEARSLCWATAAGMQPRFTEILRYQHNPPLSREFLHELYRQCMDGQAPLVDALLSTGNVSEPGLRAALFRHICEAVAHISLSGARFEEFVPRAPYRARFSFSTAEILAGLGARCDPGLALVAQRELSEMLVPDTSGWAFVRDAGKGSPVIIAVDGSFAVRGAEMLDICGWASSVFDVTAVFDNDVRIASASWFDDRCVVAWRTKNTYFAASCAGRPGAARLLSALERRLLTPA